MSIQAFNVYAGVNMSYKAAQTPREALKAVEALKERPQRDQYGCRPHIPKPTSVSGKMPQLLLNQTLSKEAS
jgi:hypothetical protein